MLIQLDVDIYPAFIPFAVQAVKADGTKIDPTSLTNAVSLYEEDGLNGTFVNSIKAQFTPVKINSQTGFYGVLIAKTNFTVGKFYLIRWTPTVDSIDTGKADEIYFITGGNAKNALDNGVILKLSK